MSQEITTAFNKQFNTNVFHLSQQQGSRLSNLVRNETQRGKEQFFDRVGPVEAVERTGRHQDTPQIDTPHSRRRVTLKDFIYADLVDDPDKIRMLIDPTSDIAKAAVWSLGRKKDDQIISSARGNAFGGEEGGTTVAMPNAQQLVATDGSDTAGVNLNVKTLRLTKKKFDAADVDESIRRYFAITSSQLESLLEETETTSSDFNTVKALVRGEINEFLGFTFVRTERLVRPDSNITFAPADGSVGAGAGTLVASTARTTMAWAEDGLLLSTAQSMMTRISERPDKNHSTQVFAQLGIGSTRMEEEKVVLVHCKEG